MFTFLEQFWPPRVFFMVENKRLQFLERAQLQRASKSVEMFERFPFFILISFILCSKFEFAKKNFSSITFVKFAQKLKTNEINGLCNFLLWEWIPSTLAFWLHSWIILKVRSKQAWLRMGLRDARARFRSYSISTLGFHEKELCDHDGKFSFV